VTMSGKRYEPLFDVHPVTGASFEVFYAASPPGRFCRGGPAWYWQLRRRGFAPYGSPNGPFATSYGAYRHAMVFGVPYLTVKLPKNVTMLPHCFHGRSAWKQQEHYL